MHVRCIAVRPAARVQAGFDVGVRATRDGREVAELSAEHRVLVLVLDAPDVCTRRGRAAVLPDSDACVFVRIYLRARPAFKGPPSHSIQGGSRTLDRTLVALQGVSRLLRSTLRTHPSHLHILYIPTTISVARFLLYLQACKPAIHEARLGRPAPFRHLESSGSAQLRGAGVLILDIRYVQRCSGSLRAPTNRQDVSPPVAPFSGPAGHGRKHRSRTCHTVLTLDLVAVSRTNAHGTQLRRKAGGDRLDTMTSHERHSAQVVRMHRVPLVQTRRLSVTLCVVWFEEVHDAGRLEHTE